MTNEHSVLSAAQVDELLLESQRLRTEVERLEAERITYHIDGEEVTAEVFNAKFQSMQVEIERLKLSRTRLLDAADDLIADWQSGNIQTKDMAVRLHALVEDVRAAAKDTPTHRDGGDAKGQP